MIPKARAHFIYLVLGRYQRNTPLGRENSCRSERTKQQYIIVIAHLTASNDAIEKLRCFQFNFGE